MGFLGHAAMADAMQDVTRLMPIDAAHINLSANLTIRDRAIRRALSLRVFPTSGPMANLDRRRWRQELNIGLLARRRLAAAERGGRFDLLHFHTQAAAYASLARMARTPTIVSIDATSRLAAAEMTSPASRRSYDANIAHDRAVFRRARAIVATSDWAARDLADLQPECADRIHVLPYPIRDVFDDRWMEERVTRSRRTPPPPVRMLFMGGDFVRKGGFDLLDAWRDADFGDRATLDLATDWPVARASLPPGVRIVRGVRVFTSTWFDLWRDADVFVMPSRNEAFGIVFEEAAAAGIPAIGTAINAIPEIIVDNRTGLTVPPDDRGALVSAMRTLVGSADLRCSLGAAARARIRERAFPAAYAAGLGAVLDRVIARPAVAFGTAEGHSDNV
ncbi:MAG TPA: glycosyltransferase family 4 protein [Vicinamibacterales bacterium]|nr:glycosyltransferase family 4 protein [Vicinamibacterales bacterium]